MADLPRPEPVTKAGTIAGAVAALIITVGGLARALGWLTQDLDLAQVAEQASNLILGAGALWATLAPFVLAVHARSKVTPLQDPRDATGQPLTPAAGSPVDTPPPAPVAPADDDGLDVTQALARLDAIAPPEPAPSSPAPAPADGGTPTYDATAAALAAQPTAVIPAVDPADETRPMAAVANGTT